MERGNPNLQVVNYLFPVPIVLVYSMIENWLWNLEVQIINYHPPRQIVPRMKFGHTRTPHGRAASMINPWDRPGLNSSRLDLFQWLMTLHNEQVWNGSRKRFDTTPHHASPTWWPRVDATVYLRTASMIGRGKSCKAQLTSKRSKPWKKEWERMISETTADLNKQHLDMLKLMQCNVSQAWFCSRLVSATAATD